MDAFCRIDYFFAVDIPRLSYRIDPRPCRVDTDLGAKSPYFTRQEVFRSHDHALARFLDFFGPRVIQKRRSSIAGGDDVLDHKPLGHEDLMVIKHRATPKTVMTKTRLITKSFIMA